MLRIDTIVSVASLLLAASCGSGAAATIASDSNGTVSGDSTSESDAPQSVVAETFREAKAANQEAHGQASDCTWTEGSATRIELSEEGSVVTGEGASIVGKSIVITAAGTYDIRGATEDGQIVVETDDEAAVKLVLNGVSLQSRTTAPIAFMEAKIAVVILAEGTDNRVSDAAVYAFASAEEDEPNAAVFSRADLSVCGLGSLSVTARFNDGVSSKDGLILDVGQLNVSAADDGIRGKDYLIVRGGTLDVVAAGDGLKSDNGEQEARGYILVEGGSLVITAEGDGIAAATDLMIAAGDLTVIAGGGADADLGESSAKGLKAGVGVFVEGGSLSIDSADDALHADDGVVVSGGVLSIRSGDDGVHGEFSVHISGGEIRIEQSYEGVEGESITFDGGSVSIVSSDDGINAAGGSASSDEGSRGGFGPGGGGFAAGDFHLYINGGTLEVDAEGDAIDSNGTVDITGGLTVVNGPTGSQNSALDCNGEFAITGGTLVSVHIDRMGDEMEGPSTQNYLKFGFDAEQDAGTLVHIQDTSGTGLLTFAPTKSYKALVFSSPQLLNGSYELYTGGESTAEALASGLMLEGAYSSGTLHTEFTVSDIETTVGAVSSGFGPPRR